MKRATKKKGKTKALAVKKEAAPIVTSTAGLMQLALQSNAGIEQLQKLMDMKYRDEEREARKEFFFALSEFQSSIGAMKKDKTVDFTSERTGKKTSYKHASLGQIESQIKEPLKNAMLTKRFEIKDDTTGITVICVVTHVNGHSEKTSMTAPADNSGGKNTIQSRASTVTYLQRYTLIGALGLVTADEDNDGGTSDPPKGPEVLPPEPPAPPAKPDPKINALKRLFQKLNPGKSENQLRSLWVDQIGEETLTDERIKELAQEFTVTLKERNNKNAK